MNTSELKNLTENLLETFIKAGQEALDLRKKGLKTIIKPDNSPVTNGDLEVDKKIKEKINEITPNIPLISEETVHLNQKKIYKNFWLVDPIDGTKDYIKNKDEFTINASLINNLEPILGIIYAPAKKRLFYSYGNGFAFEESNNNKKKLECKKKTKIGEIIALTNSSNLDGKILKIHSKFKVNNFVSMRSSYKFCVIASGEYDLYAAHARAFEWDIASGHAIVKHAGGIVTTLKGKEFKYGKIDYKNVTLLVRRSKNLEK